MVCTFIEGKDQTFIRYFVAQWNKLKLIYYFCTVIRFISLIV